jgi:hypothetical protein
VFLHVTVVPTATFSSPGEKALFPKNSALMGMVTADDGASGAGVGDGAGVGAVGAGELLSPQAMASTRVTEATPRRNDNIGTSLHE